jgi:diaminopimelate epimerase
MELDFYKIHTCQNDLILISYLYNREPPAAELFPAISRAMCRRHLGVGANGLVVLLPGIEHPVKMLVFRPNGEAAAVHNDALLCMSRYAFDSGIAGGNRIGVECSDGVRSVDFIDSTNFRISVGAPKSLKDMSDIRERPDAEYQQTIEIDEKRLPVTPLFLQYPAAIVFSGDRARSKLMRMSRGIRNAPEFQSTVHPIFCKVYSKDEVEVHTWFKREAIDYSSAAAAATVGAVLNGLTDREAIVHCNRQELYVQWVQSSNEVLVTSAAAYLFSGTYYVEEESVEQRGPNL